VAVAGKRLRVPRASLVAVAGAQPRPAQAPAARGPRGGGAQLLREHGGGRGSTPDFATINLVGLTVDEALPRVDKLLDDAALADRRQVRVIHGFGAGTLRRAVAGLLDGHPHVATFRTAAANEGGGGVTIVELKE
jgi:DNA mismatch repair protein MutS2